MKIKKNKNLVIVYENFLYGGTTTHLINLINSSSFRDFGITILTNKNNETIKELKKKVKGKKVRLVIFKSLNAIYFENFLSKIIYLFLQPILFIISIIQFYIILKKINYNFFLANCGGYGGFRSEISAIFSSRLNGIKNNFLLIHHNYQKPRFWSFFLILIDNLVKYFIKKIIFVSSATMKSVLNNSGLKSSTKSKYTVIYNGLNQENKNKKKALIFKKNKKVINLGMLSRIEKYKGQEDLIKSIELLKKEDRKKFHVIFVGRGEKNNLKNVKSYIAQKKLKKYFTFKNYIRKDSISILKNFDIFLSLTRDFEGFGYSIAEAMLSKIPIISTNVGGTKEFLNKKNSNIVKPHSPENIKELLKDYLKNKNQWLEKAKYASKYISRKHNSEIMGAKFKKIFIQ